MIPPKHLNHNTIKDADCRHTLLLSCRRQYGQRRARAFCIPYFLTFAIAKYPAIAETLNAVERVCLIVTGLPRTRAAAGDELHALRYDILCVFHQEMNVVGGHYVVEHAKPKPLLCFEDPVQIAPPGPRKL